MDMIQCHQLDLLRVVIWRKIKMPMLIINVCESEVTLKDRF
jgi:hypothetical protein